MRVMFLAATALALSACSPSGIVLNGPSDTVVMTGKKALGVAHNSYQAIAWSLVPLIGAGVFSKADLTTIDRLNKRALHLLEKGDAGMTEAARATELFSIVEQLTKLKGDH